MFIGLLAKNQNKDLIDDKILAKNGMDDSKYQFLRTQTVLKYARYKKIKSLKV